jgi:HEAT repeat protein
MNRVASPKNPKRLQIMKARMLILVLGIAAHCPVVSDPVREKSLVILKGDEEHPFSGNKELAKEIAVLIQVFADPEARGDNIETSQFAIKQLAKIGKPAVPQLMEAMLGKNETVASYSGLALEKIGFQGVEQVRKKWPNLTEAQKWKFMRFRGSFDYEMSLDFALVSLKSKDAAVRRQAIEYLGEHKEAKARQNLLKMLNTEAPELHRWFVIKTLAKIGNNNEVVDALIELLAKDSWAARGKGLPHIRGNPPPWWPDGREHIIDALGEMDARKAAPKLLGVLQEKGQDKAYLDFAIVPLLGDWGYNPSIPVLKRILVADKDCLHLYIARALLQLKDRSGMSVLLQALKSEDWSERHFAAEAFAKHGDKSDVLLLGHCLKDEEEIIQLQACQGLERITGVINRAQGQTMLTSADIRLWIEWLERNKGKYHRKK